jgi:hypothetical protein
MALDRNDFDMRNLPDVLNATYKGSKTGQVIIVPDDSGNYNFNASIPIEKCNEVVEGTVKLKITSSSSTVTYDDVSANDELELQGGSTSIGSIGPATAAGYYTGTLDIDVTFQSGTPPDDDSDIILQYDDACGNTRQIIVAKAYDGVEGAYKTTPLPTGQSNFSAYVCTIDPCGEETCGLYVDDVLIGNFDDNLEFQPTHNDYQPGGTYSVSGYIRNPSTLYEGELGRVVVSFSPNLPDGKKITLVCGTDTYNLRDCTQCCDYNIDFAGGSLGGSNPTTDIEITSIVVNGNEVLQAPSGALTNEAETLAFLNGLGLGMFTQSDWTDFAVTNLDVVIESLTFTNDLGGTPSTETAEISQTNCV